MGYSKPQPLWEIFLFIILFVTPNLLGAAAWKRVDLPARPINLTSQDGALWVCGANELIASSVDAETTWQIKHLTEGGELLTQIRFVNDQVGYAAGTNGLLLWTHDAGSTWKATRGDAQLPTNLLFADDHHGIRSTYSGVALTADGGATWQTISAMRSYKELARFTYVAGVAGLDGTHFAILLMEDPYADWRLFVTTDAGQTWKVVVIPHTAIRNLAVRHGEYWVFGHEVVGWDRPGGGYGVAAAFHSSDGEHWAGDVRSPKEFTECNAQGCLLWDGAIVDVFGKKPVYTIVPATGELTSTWSAAGGIVCSVREDLQCVASVRSETLPPFPHGNDTQAWVLSWPRPKLDVPNCIRCSYPQLLILRKSEGAPVDPRKLALTSLNVFFTVRKDGAVTGIQVKQASSPAIAAAVVEIAQSWLFVPAIRDGVHVEQQREMRLQFWVLRR